MGKLTPCLWFATEAEEAAQFYTSVFKDSTILNVTRWGETGPGEPGSVLTVDFEIAGHKFLALNGRPSEFSFTEASSFQIDCESQEEVDYYWERLTDGGEESQCGWLKDKFGMSWQVVPSVMDSLIGGPDPDGAARAMQAMMTMHKLDIPTLERAYAGTE